MSEISVKYIYDVNEWWAESRTITIEQNFIPRIGEYVYVEYPPVNMKGPVTKVIHNVGYSGHDVEVYLGLPKREIN